MSQRLVIDPITRIQGNLRIEAQLDGNRVVQAYCSGTTVRGIELVLRGRDPRDAWVFTQRICSACSLAHGLASIRAVENALNIPIPPNAHAIRNLMHAAQHVHSHVTHFYHLHAVDWVDVVAALNADPVKTSTLAESISTYSATAPSYFAATQQRLKNFVADEPIGIFAHAYWGHPAYKLPPEINLLVMAHYLDALDWQREVVKLQAIFGGKNPHPHLLVGGVACCIDLNSDSALNAKHLAQVQTVITQMQNFVEQVYLPDLFAIANFYTDWSKRGEGLGNFLTYGDFSTLQPNQTNSLLLPSGAILNRDFNVVHHLDFQATNEIEEYVTHSWYDYASGKTTGLHPFAGETNLKFDGPTPPFEHLNVEKSYSWIKAPRWHHHAMEVGPLARMVIGYALDNNVARELLNAALSKLNLPNSALFSTLGRIIARGLEAKMLVTHMQTWYNQLLYNIKSGDTSTFNPSLWEPITWPYQAQGVGYAESPRGALAHWVVIENGLIQNYQVIGPSAWNVSPRDQQNQPGPCEAALAHNHTLHDATQPLELLRTIHSFDPCSACAAHALAS